MYDPLSTTGKCISRGSQGSTEGETRGTSEASKGAQLSERLNDWNGVGYLLYVSNRGIFFCVVGMTCYIPAMLKSDWLE